MTKLLLLFALITTTLISSCSKDDDKEPEFSLLGKIYAAHAYTSSVSENEVYWVMRFTSNTALERTAREVNPTGGIIGDIENWTYTLSYPTLIIYDEDGEEYNNATFIDENTFRTTNYQGHVTEYILQ